MGCYTRFCSYNQRIAGLVQFCHPHLGPHVDLALFQVVVELFDRVEVFVGVAEEDALFSGHGS